MTIWNVTVPAGVPEEEATVAVSGTGVPTTDIVVVAVRVVVVGAPATESWLATEKSLRGLNHRNRPLNRRRA